jgi:hypothetical protein
VWLAGPLLVSGPLQWCAKQFRTHDHPGLTSRAPYTRDIRPQIVPQGRFGLYSHIHGTSPICRAFRVGETGFEPATARPPAGCATRLRHSPWQQAGDRNRTGTRSLEGFGAAITLRPHALANLTGAHACPPTTHDPYRRSSTGTSPDSSARPGGGHGPIQLSRAPSSVTVEPLKARPRGEASSATSQACSAASPRR